MRATLATFHVLFLFLFQLSPSLAPSQMKHPEMVIPARLGHVQRVGANKHRDFAILGNLPSLIFQRVSPQTVPFGLMQAIMDCGGDGG